MKDYPIYVPTQEEKEDPYFKSLLDQVDLSSLEQLNKKLYDYSFWNEDLQTNEKYIHQYIVSYVKKIGNSSEEELYKIVSS